MSDPAEPASGPSLMRLGGPGATALADDQGAADAEARVVAEGVAKTYGPVEVLRGVDLRLAPRSLVAIAGSNGVGKSTLLGCLAGTIKHDGRILFHGQPIGRAARGRISYLPQRLRLPSTATGREVMRLFGSTAGAGEDRVEVPDGFLPDMRKPLGRLSGGQAQRVALAAVLRGSPDLILLDEPFANLDDDARTHAHQLLRAHRDAGATVLVASPTALDLLAVTDRVLALEDGAIAFDGAPTRYAGRLEMTLWVRPGDCDEDCLAGLDHVLRARREGDWLALECREDHIIGLLQDLEAAGVPPDRVRLGGPTMDVRLRSSPADPPSRGSA